MKTVMWFERLGIGFRNLSSGACASIGKKITGAPRAHYEEFAILICNAPTGECDKLLILDCD